MSDYFAVVAALAQAPFVVTLACLAAGAVAVVSWVERSAR